MLSMRRCLGPIAMMLVAAGCASSPTNTAATPVVTANLTSTPGPSATLPAAPIGPTSDQEPSATPPAGTVTVTPEAIATSTPTPGAKSPAPSAKVEIKFQAPVPLGPSRPTMFKDGNNITFRYASVGRLAPNYCYLLHIEMINPNVNPGNRGDDFLDKYHCGDQSVAGKRLSFVLYRSKFKNLPNYGTILPEALGLAQLLPKQLLRVTWYVRVVQNNGLSDDNVHYLVKPLSPPGAVLDFDFEPPS